MLATEDMLFKIKGIEENFNHNYEIFFFHLTTVNRKIDSMEKSVFHEANRAFNNLDVNLTNLEKQFGLNYTRFQRYLTSIQRDLESFEKRIEREAKRWFLSLMNKITDCEKMLQAYDPQLKLKQGFSIVKDKTGRVVKSRKTLKIRDIITVQLFDGVLDSKIEDIR